MVPQMIKGNVDSICSGIVSGWCFDTENVTQKCEVFVEVNGENIGSSTANIFRTDLLKAKLGDGCSGFRVDLTKDVHANQLESLKCIAVIQQPNGFPRQEILPIGRNANKISADISYQSFEGKPGDSNSFEKLRRLRVPKLQGKSVLDIGCNEGFFCKYAIDNGASRVVGIDQNDRVIKKAIKNAPGADFICDSWWNIPDEKFDVIFFLSAIHYEKTQDKLLSFLLQHLTRDGILILECGVIDSDFMHYISVQRHDGVFRYPTIKYLVNILLKDYSVSLMNKSIFQTGDPIERFVFHCSPLKTTFLLVYGKSRVGKTFLTSQFGQISGAATYSLDQFFDRILHSENVPQNKLTEFIQKKCDMMRLDACGIEIIQNSLENILSEYVLTEIPAEAKVCILEGEVLAHPEFRLAISSELKKIGPVWEISPL